MNGGEIKNVLTLDVSKFDSAVKKATAQLDKLDARLDKVGKVADKLDKGVSSLSSELGNAVGNFQILDRVVGNLSRRMDDVQGSVEKVGKAGKKASTDLNKLVGSAEKLESMGDWTAHYGKALDKLNPLIGKTVKTHKEMDKEFLASAKKNQQSQVDVARARARNLAQERSDYQDQIKQRRQMIAQLEKIESRAQVTATVQTAEADRYRGRNYSSPKRTVASNAAALAREEASAAAAQRKNLEAIVKEITWKNAQLRAGVIESMREVQTLRELAALDAARVQHQRALSKAASQYRAEQAQQLRDNKALNGNVANVMSSISRKGGSAADSAAVFTQHFAEQKQAWAKHFNDLDALAEQARVKTAPKVASIMKGITVGGESYASRHKSYEKLWADMDNSAQKRADEEIRQAQRAEKARIAAARRAAAVEKQEAAQVVQMWKEVGTLYAGAKAAQAIGAGTDAASQYQQADLRLKLYNLPAEQYEEFKVKVQEMAKENPFLSLEEAMRLRMDAMSALGYNNQGVIDATIPQAAKAANVLKMGGYDNSDLSTITKNLYGMVEARQVQYDAEETKRTMEFAVKAAAVSQGKITVQDMETFLRNAGDLRATLNLDGLARIVPLLEQFKVAGGGSGGGSGVASVGTMVKMLSMYGSGKPMTNKAVEQLIGAGILNDGVAQESVEQFRETAKTTQEFQKMLKQQMKYAGFKDSKQLGQDPLGFIAKMRDPLLNFMMKDGNFGTYFGGREKVTRTNDGKLQRADGSTLDKKDQYEMEMQGFKSFFARMGMSTKAVDGMLTALNSEQIQRADHVVEQIKNAKDLDAAYKATQATWRNAVAEMNAGAKNLAAGFEPLLQAVSWVPQGIGAILNAAGQFASNNPLASTAILTTAALVGLNLTVGSVVRSMSLINAGMRVLQGLGAGTAASTAVATGAINDLAVANASAATKTTATTKATTAASAAQRVMAGASKGLSVGLSLIGGPLGAIALALTVGITAWQMWGNAARKAFKEAESGIQGSQDIIDRIKKEQKFGSGELGSERSKYEQAKKLYAESRDRDQKAFNSIQQGGGFAENGGGAAFGKAKFDSKAVQDKSGKAAPVSDESRRLGLAMMKAGEAVSLMERQQKEQEAATKVPAVTLPETVPASTLMGGGASGSGGSKKGKREFQDTFQIKLSQLIGDANAARLEADGLLNDSPNYDARANDAFIKAWMSGQFDDGKDPSKRAFAKGKYDPKRGWSQDDIDFDGAKQSGSVQDFLKATTEKLQQQDRLAAVSFAKGKMDAAAQDVASAFEQLTEKTKGQSDSMVALNREFARFEAKNPGTATDKDYQSLKRGSVTNVATSDALKLAQTMKDAQPGRLLDLNTGMSDYRKQIESAKRAADLEQKNMDARTDALRKQIAAHEEAGDTASQAYKDALAALAEITPIYEQQSKILIATVEAAKKTAVQKNFDEWSKMEDQYNSLATSWQSNIATTLQGVLTGNGAKIDLKAFGATVASDLSGMLLKSAMSDMNTGIFGSASFFEQAKNLYSGNAIEGGGWLGGKLNEWRQVGASTQAGLTSGMGDGLSTATGMSGVTEGGLGFIDTAKNAFNDLTASLGTFGQSVSNIGVSLMDGLGSSLDWVTDGLSGLGEGLLEGMGAVGEFSITLITDGLSALWAWVASMWAAEASTTASTMLANGGVLSQSGLHAFAKGSAFTNGIYNSPTLFKFANGGGFSNGVMGEAGPEAVMPLTRDSSGRLGVTVQNPGGAQTVDAGTNVVITINVANDGGSASGDSSSSAGQNADTWKTMANRVKGLVVQEIVNQKRPGGALWK